MMARHEECIRQREKGIINSITTWRTDSLSKENDTTKQNGIRRGLETYNLYSKYSSVL
jgi:hypothetical protein